MGERIHKKIREEISTEHWLVRFHDGIRAHITLQVIQIFLDAKIAIMELPAYTSHRLQELDMRLFN